MCWYDIIYIYTLIRNMYMSFNESKIHALLNISSNIIEKKNIWECLKNIYHNIRVHENTLKKKKINIISS